MTSNNSNITSTNTNAAADEPLALGIADEPLALGIADEPPATGITGELPALAIDALASSSSAVSEPLALGIDIGNSVTRFGVFTNERMMATWRCSTRESMTTDEARLMLIAFLTSEKLPIPTSGIISSVVPGLTDIWAEALKLTVNARALIVGPGIKTGMQMRYNDPAEVGSDRIADCVAARAKHGSPVLVVDLGVSTNIMVVGDDGAFLGGLLAPGLALAARALFGAAARLPVVELTKPTTVIGKNTGDAMRSGLVLGEAARINGLIELIWEELGYQTKIVVTGSEAKAIASLLKYEVLVEPDLTLYGLMLLHQKNRH